MQGTYRGNWHGHRKYVNHTNSHKENSSKIRVEFECTMIGTRKAVPFLSGKMIDTSWNSAQCSLCILLKTFAFLIYMVRFLHRLWIFRSLSLNNSRFHGITSVFSVHTWSCAFLHVTSRWSFWRALSRPETYGFCSSFLDVGNFR